MITARCRGPGCWLARSEMATSACRMIMASLEAVADEADGAPLGLQVGPPPRPFAFGRSTDAGGGNAESRGDLASGQADLGHDRDIQAAPLELVDNGNRLGRRTAEN